MTIYEKNVNKLMKKIFHRVATKSKKLRKNSGFWEKGLATWYKHAISKKVYNY